MVIRRRRSRALYLGLLGAILAERLFELGLSRRNARRAFAQGAVEVERRRLPWMVGAHALFLPACAAEVFWKGRPFPRRIGPAALGVTLCAQALRYWAVSTLGERWNVRIIVWPSRAPVTTGPYRYLRHPNYLAVALEAAAVPLVHGAWWTAALFSAANAALLADRIRAEERALGPAWAQAFERLPRLIPSPPAGAAPASPNPRSGHRPAAGEPS